MTTITEGTCSVRWYGDPRFGPWQYELTPECYASSPLVDVPASPSGPGIDGLYGTVAAAFPEAPARAWAIVGCETGYRYDNSLVGRQGEVSIWQIHPIHFGRFPRARLQESVVYATWAARVMYDEAGGSFRAWSCAR